MIIKCHRCLRTWNYQGANKFFASCPSCKTSVSIKKRTLVEMIMNG